MGPPRQRRNPLPPLPSLLLSAGVGMSMERCAVYLGASQPVSGTHVAMVTALLGAGHDIVFVFLLRWRPERFGTSADASAKVLRGWIDSSLGAEESAKRVVITPIQNDYEGAGLMRAHLGPDVDPKLLVNYSKKYSPERFKPRIENDWMPLYRKEFPKAEPSFLADELDPGGEGAAGTGNAPTRRCSPRRRRCIVQRTVKSGAPKAPSSTRESIRCFLTTAPARPRHGPAIR